MSPKIIKATSGGFTSRTTQQIVDKRIKIAVLINDNPLNQGGLTPNIVDPTTPALSYELPSVWAG